MDARSIVAAIDEPTGSSLVTVAGAEFMASSMDVVPRLRGAGGGGGVGSGQGVGQARSQDGEAGHDVAELPVRWMAGSSQLSDDASPRNVRRRASLTFRCG